MSNTFTKNMSKNYFLYLNFFNIILLLKITNNQESFLRIVFENNFLTSIFKNFLKFYIL